MYKAYAGICAVAILALLPLSAYACQTLSLGSSGPAVLALQKILSRQVADFPSSDLTGYFGRHTQQAVQEWQAARGVVSSGSPQSTGWGTVGPKTNAAMGLCAGNSLAANDTQSTMGSLYARIVALQAQIEALLAMASSSGATSTSTASPALSSCTFNGAILQSGSSINAYASPNVGAGLACTSQTRTCENGVLSGSYAYASCSQSAPTITATLTQSLATTSSDGTSDVNDQAFTVSWSSTGATICTVEKQAPDGSLFNPWATGTSGSKTAYTPSIGIHHFSITCSGPSGSAQADMFHQVVGLPLTDILLTPRSFSQKYSFVPNQMASIPWNLANGHIEDSFSNLALWQQLQKHLLANNGGIGIYANELWHTTNATLASFRSEGLAIEVDEPGMTQCTTGSDIANAEINGTGPFCNSPQFGGINLCGKGWFVTKDGNSFTPDEIDLDERIADLLGPPAAPVDYCPQDGVYNDDPNSPRVTNLVNDYVDYANIVRQKWPTNTPKIALYWNVTTTFDDATSSAILDRVVTALCNDSFCPSAVYMDVDWKAIPAPQLVSILKSEKSILSSHGVAFGIALAGGAAIEENSDNVVTETADKSGLYALPCSGCSKNGLYQGSDLNIMDWLHDAGVLDGDTRLHIQSWYSIPQEIGAGVSETIPYTLANTADRIFNEVLVRYGVAH